jgi:hypothetical protein
MRVARTTPLFFLKKKFIFE